MISSYSKYIKQKQDIWYYEKTLICFFDYNLNGNFLLKGIAFRDKVVARRPRKKKRNNFCFFGTDLATPQHK